MSNKHAFWQALILAVIIFSAGIFMGFLLEGERNQEVTTVVMNSEISLLDDQLRNKFLDDFGVGCDVAVESTFNFADRIYFEALSLEQYDEASKFSDTLDLLHRRYDLLRVLLWSNSQELKETCKNDFNTVLYLYEYKTEEIQKKSLQLTYSRILSDLKNDYSGDVLLIPVAVDTNLESVNLIVSDFGLQKFPAIVINGEHKFTGVITQQEIEEKLEFSN